MAVHHIIEKQVLEKSFPKLTAMFIDITADLSSHYLKHISQLKLGSVFGPVINVHSWGMY